ncbi:MAG: VWA domain-containing protein [Clostridia bacterium]|nr:VWA domain-containing protein [Clostridia bacterium]
MSFLQPLGLLGLIGVPIIIIIYIIKSRFVQKPVASTFIWKRSLKYVKRKIPLSIILSLLLILQILTVVAASLAIARPTIKPFKSNEEILILDASASMQSSFEGKTRFEAAKEKILEEAEGIGSNNRISVILAGTKAETIIERSEDKINIRYELEDITCTDGDADVEGALELASKIQELNAGATIKLITDKDYENVEGLEVVNIARTGEYNVSILNVTDEQLLTGDYQFTAEVVSYGRGTECAIGIYIDDDDNDETPLVLLGSKNIILPNTNMNEGGTVNVIFTPNRLLEETETQIVVPIDNIQSYKEVKVVIEDDGGIETDNEYYLYSLEKTIPKILFVSSKFKTTGDGAVDVNKPTSLYVALSSNGYVPRSDDMFKSVEAALQAKGELKGYDLYIFEGVEPPEGEDFPTDGAVWLLNPSSIPSAVSGIAMEQETVDGDFTMILASMSQTNTYQTITKNLDCQVGVGRYKPMTHGGNFEKIFSCNGNEACLIAGTSGGVRMVVTSFDFNYSSWPVKITDYILLINNLVTYSIPDVLPSRDFEIGQIVQFNAPAGANKLTFKYEGIILDETEDLDMKFILDKVGVYEVEVTYSDETKVSYMMPTHIPNSESNIVIVGENVVAAEIPADSVVEAEPIEIFPYLIALLILLLVTEWGVYHRDGV